MLRLSLYLFLFLVDASSAATFFKNGDYVRGLAFVGLGIWVCAVLSRSFGKAQ